MSDDVALLLSRAGFGPTAPELAAARKAGRGAALSALVEPAGPDVAATSAPVPRLGLDPFADMPDPTDDQRAAAYAVRDRQTALITRWWLDRMTVAGHQAVERLLFFWHGHWATSIDKVRSPQLMLAQHRTLREAPDFAAMARRMVVDPALVYWLDGQLNTKVRPNENLGRELMELFLLGIGRYTEKDVKEAGRALTGWRVSLGSERCVPVPGEHDTGTKTILGTTRHFAAGSLVDMLLDHPATPGFIASRLWFRYASSTEPIPAATRERMVTRFPAPLLMLRALFEDDAFYATRRTMVKQPVEWLVGAMRQLGLRMGTVPVEVATLLIDGLTALGQVPFGPPSVGGWPSGTAWLTSAAAQVRLRLAAALADRTDLANLTPESLAYLLAVEGWTNRTYALLRGIREPRRLLTLGLVSPEYLVT